MHQTPIRVLPGGTGDPSRPLSQSLASSLTPNVCSQIIVLAPLAASTVAASAAPAAKVVWVFGGSTHRRAFLYGVCVDNFQGVDTLAAATLSIAGALRVRHSRRHRPGRRRVGHVVRFRRPPAPALSITDRRRPRSCCPRRCHYPRAAASPSPVAAALATCRCPPRATAPAPVAPTPVHPRLPPSPPICTNASRVAWRAAGRRTVCHTLAIHLPYTCHLYAIRLQSACHTLAICVLPALLTPMDKCMAYACATVCHTVNRMPYTLRSGPYT